MTPEEIYQHYHDTEPVVGEAEVRVSPNRLRVARRIPDSFVRNNKPWISMYFIDHIGLTVALMSDEDVADWVPLAEKEVGNEEDAESGKEGT
jgi:hypothetical protein